MKAPKYLYFRVKTANHGTDLDIEDASDVDVVEVVRCKDCDWWTKQEDSPRGRCALFQIYSTGGWFCGSAERREDGCSNQQTGCD